MWVETDLNTGRSYLDLFTTNSATYFLGYEQLDFAAVFPNDQCVLPALGYDYWGIYISCVLYTSNGFFQGNGTIALSIDRMIAGAPGSPVGYSGFLYWWSSVDTNLGSSNPALNLSPAIEDGVPQAEWLVASNAGWLGSATSKDITTCAITNTVIIFQGLNANPPMTCVNNNLPLAYSDPIGAAQPGTSTRLNAGLGFNQISYRGGQIAFALLTVVACSGQVHSALLWGEITPQLSTLAAHNPQQAAPIASAFTQAAYQCNSGADLFMPTAIASAENDLTLIYNYSNGTNVYPSVVYTGRANTDAPNTMGQGGVSKFIIQGFNSNGVSNWGIYTGCALAGSGLSRGTLTCVNQYGGANTSLAGYTWDTYMSRLRME